MADELKFNLGYALALKGKSAYKYALEGGYTGTETEFAELMGTIDLAAETTGANADAAAESAANAAESAESAQEIVNNLGQQPYVVNTINTWLDEHPEATTTVQDGAITAQKLTEAFRTQVNGNPVNVLSLGVKNDGLVDCSAIVNKATKDSELYFPAGKYLVSEPLQLKHSIYGAGASRQFTATSTEQGARLISKVSGTESSGVVQISASGCDVKGLHIVCDGSECGILINTNQSAQSCTVENCVISNVSSYGIYINVDKRNSRIGYIRGCSIFGKNFAASCGIRIQGEAFDCVVSDCEIMGVQTGIRHNAGIFRCYDTHIWTGCASGADTEDWWKNTYGVFTESVCILSNVYIDSAHVGVSVRSTYPLSMYNCVIVTDESMTGTSSSTQYPIYINTSPISQASVTVDGLYVGDRGRMTELINSGVGTSPGISLANIKVTSSQELLPTTRIYPRLGSTYFSDTYKRSVAAGTCAEVACFSSRYGGNVALDLYSDNNHVRLAWTKAGFVKECVNGDIRLFYKTEDYVTWVYVYNGGTSNMSVQGTRAAYGNAVMTTYGNMARSPRREPLIPAPLTSTDGLTEITVSE